MLTFISISKCKHLFYILDMRISYAPLWKTMKNRSISSYKLIKEFGFNTRTLNNIKHNESITMYTLGRLCEILSCTPNDVVEFHFDE